MIVLYILFYIYAYQRDNSFPRRKITGKKKNSDEFILLVALTHVRYLSTCICWCAEELYFVDDLLLYIVILVGTILQSKAQI